MSEEVWEFLVGLDGPSGDELAAIERYVVRNDEVDGS